MAASSDSNPPPPPPSSWTEEEELRLLKAVLEIAKEPAEAFDPRICLFYRIRRRLRNKSLSNVEILAKVNDLKRIYEKKHDKIRKGMRVGAYDSELFEISQEIWGLKPGQN